MHSLLFASAFVACFLPNTCSAFLVNKSGGKHFFGVKQHGSRFAPSAVYNARVDSSDAVADALRISREKGATSSEARVAWDIVEELDASDNSVAYKIQPVRPDHIDDYRNQIRAFPAPRA